MRRPLVGVAIALLVLAGCAGTDGGPDTGAAVVSTPTAAPASPGRPPAQSDLDEPDVPRPTDATLRAPRASRDVPVRPAAGLPQVSTDSAPVRVTVPALGAQLPVDPVGIAPDGQMEIPPDAARAGWYRFGPTAGAAAGTAVIAAHSGSHITALGPLRDIIELEAGDTISVTLADGAELTYAVDTAELIPKTTIDLSEHFRRDGEHRLVLITCDGVWQDDVQSYTDNTVVTATLVTP